MNFFQPFLAINDGNDGKTKEKSLFGLDPSSFIKLKALKVLSPDSISPNIMRLYFPRNKNVEKNILIDAKNGAKGKIGEPTLAASSNGNQFSEKELKKDFIEVDNILVVRDPKNIDTLLANEQIVEVSSESLPEATTLQPTQNTVPSDSQPEKRNFDTLLNRSPRLKKIVDKFNAKKNGKSAKSNGFDKQSPERELFKREGNPNEQMKDIPEKSNPHSRPDETSIVSSTDAPTTQPIEQSATEINPPTTESSDKTTVTENSEKIIGNDDGDLVGISLDTLRAEQKNVEKDKKRIEDDKRKLQIDEEKLNNAQTKRDFDQTMLDVDQMQLTEDKEKLLADLELSDSIDLIKGDAALTTTTEQTHKKKTAVIDVDDLINVNHDLIS